MKIRGVEKPKDFVVKESIDKKFLRSFERTGGGVRKIEGPYTLLLLTKKDLTTFSALKIIAKRLGIPVSSVGYAGLKDRFAVTSQYITIKNSEKENLEFGGVKLEKIGKTNRHISVGDLEGNEFVITLHKFNKKNPEKILDKIRTAGFPNYFGAQRFGRNNNNHVIGGLIIKRDFGKALGLINRDYGKNFRSLHEIGKKRLKFFLHAYQSWIFNAALEECVKIKDVPKTIDVVGCDTKTKDKILLSLLNKEKIRPSDFRIDELRISCRGGKRNTVVKTDVKYERFGRKTRLSFFLPKGSYATVLLELFRS